MQDRTILRTDRIYWIIDAQTLTAMGEVYMNNIQTHSNSDRRNRFDPTEAVTLAKKNFTGNCSDRHNRHEHNNNFDRQNWPHHNRYRDDRHTGDYCTNIERTIFR